MAELDTRAILPHAADSGVFSACGGLSDGRERFALIRLGLDT
jgi:hypothetical protein